MLLKIIRENIMLILTLSNSEKVVPSSSEKLLFSLMDMSCLFSSQVPSSFHLEENLKLVEVHQVFLRHCWPQDNKLGESNRLATYPRSFLFCKVSKEEKREVSGLSSAEKRTLPNKKNNTTVIFEAMSCSVAVWNSLCSLNKTFRKMWTHLCLFVITMHYGIVYAACDNTSCAS